MAILKQRMHRKNASGTYDVIHLETEAGVVLRSDGTTVEDALSNPQSISTGGTNASTGAAALYNLISACEAVSDTSTISDSDMLGILDTSSQTAKKISLKELLNLSGGGSEPEEPEEPVTNPNWPDKSQLTLGNTITWAGQEWIVSHVTSREAYLTLKGLSSSSQKKWDDLQDNCDKFEYRMSMAQNTSLACLKTVDSGNTFGKVFVASYNQMSGGFSYFNSDSRRKVAGAFGMGERYWTSTSWDSSEAYGVDSDGNISPGTHYDKSNPIGFRPSVCVNLTLYNQ